jgi:hypothetical protein
MQAMPAATGSASSADARCRAGGAQAAAVWPLPHTATLKVLIDLDGPTSPAAAVPALTDVNRGWESHLERAMRIDVDESESRTGVGVCGRTLLTGWPEPRECPLVLRAMAELGFGVDAVRTFHALGGADDDLAVLAASARWFQLADHATRFAELDAQLGTIAVAAHGVAASSTAVPGPAWLAAAFAALTEGLAAIEQPDVAQRIAAIPIGIAKDIVPADELAELMRAHDRRWSWPGSNLAAAATYVSAIRSVVVDDRGLDLRLLPDLPVSWRGRTIDVLGVPLAAGARLSYGLRWHGPRPALLWEVTGADDLAVRLSVPGIDPDFSTTEYAGEALLADPGWNRA